MRDLPHAPPPAAEPVAPGRFSSIPWLKVLGIVLLLVAILWAGRQVSLVRESIAWSELQLKEMEARLAEIPPLSETELGELRRSLNDDHIEAAQAYGMEPVIRRSRLVRAARDSGLVRLEATPRYRFLDATHSVPVATHGVRRALDSMSVRFWADLEARQLPGFRFTISSMLRSVEDQAALRNVNVNASAKRSSHEYGTTFDVTYARFGYKGGPEPELRHLPRALAPIVRGQTRSYLLTRRERAYRRLASEHSEELAASLGRALIALEDQGVLLALRERRQPVYHITATLDDRPPSEGTP